ncbi:MAG TPA: nuclease-related domain-containing protein [Acidimicrobiales bacterium]|nr:nuclease-related domain-containing protein [Acidimicrobiales bacterium]
MDERGELSADKFAAKQRKDAARHRAIAERLEERASRTERAAETEFNMARQLDALLTPVGYHCLHDCVWPGTRAANLDHVLIGPGGVFVVDDKYYSSEVRTGTDGRVWAGRFPFEKELDKARAQATALALALGEPVTPILAIHGSRVTAPSPVGGAHLLPAREVPSLIQRQPSRLRPTRVATLAGMDALRPAASTPPTPPVPKRRQAPRGITRASSLRPLRTVPPVRARGSRRRSARGVSDLARLALALALLAIGWFLLQPKDGPQAAAERTIHSEVFKAVDITIDSSYVCSRDGELHHLVAMTGYAITGAERAVAPEGPWEPMELLSGKARTAVPPGQNAYVRLHRVGPGGVATTSIITSLSPAGGCQ